MVKTLNLMASGNNLPLADGGMKFSKLMLVEKIELHEDFRNLYVIDEQVLNRIVKTMKETGFDNSQPVHIWHTTGSDGIEHWYLIDGYTRLKASGIAGITRIPVFEHDFETFEEAYRYVLSLQVNRRNLDSGELIKNVELLLETGHVKDFEGDKAELISREIGYSKRTVQKAIALEKNGGADLLESVKKGEVSINQAYSRMQSEKEPSKYETRKAKVVRKKKVLQTCYLCDLYKAVFYLLVQFSEGRNPEDLLAGKDFQDLLEKPSEFEITEDIRKKMNAFGYENYLSEEK